MQTTEYIPISRICRHRREGEGYCDACRAYNRQKMNEYRNQTQTEEQKRHHRLMSSARGRAQRRLASMYPEQYEKLRDEEWSRLQRKAQ